MAKLVATLHLETDAQTISDGDRKTAGVAQEMVLTGPDYSWRAVGVSSLVIRRVGQVNLPLKQKKG